ncbi:MAG: class I SAM-dependent methyltransferase [Solirubrobacterales bacterium]
MGAGRRLYDATWGRVFASIYERALAESEDAGMRERRRELLAGARGRTVELGAGTGLNFAHYPDAVDELILTEPFPPMAKQLRERAGEGATVVEAPADRLPLPDGAADTVVSTLVLCTVDDVPATLAEVARVLRPGGRLLFAEHVRSEDPDLARWQDRLMRPWKFVGHGCRCNRDTLAAISASPLEVESVEHGAIPKAAPIVRPLIVGSARRPG